MPPKQLTCWQELLRENLPSLSLPQVRVLALYSFAVASNGYCGLTHVATWLSLTLQQPWSRLRQRLREFYKPAETKRGQQRRELEVSLCFTELLAWILRLSKSDRLALGIDATSLSDRFVVLSISVLYRATAIPVAWCVVPGNTKAAWKPQWLRMFQLLREALPPEVFVLVCADRGLYAPWLFTAIVDCGWHPMLRVNNQGGFQSHDGRSFRRFSDVLADSNHEVSLAGVAFSGNPVACTLLAYHSPIHRDPWLVLTDLPPDRAHVQWYGLRGWIEQGFKAIKRGAFQWQHTRMRDAARVERLWLVLAVATLLVLLLATRQEDLELAQYHLRHTAGGSADANATVPSVAVARRTAVETMTHQTTIIGEPRTANGSRRRRLRLPRLGQLVLFGLLFSHRALGTLYLDPEPWRDHPPWTDIFVFNEQLSEHPP